LDTVISNLAKQLVKVLLLHFIYIVFWSNYLFWCRFSQQISTGQTFMCSSTLANKLKCVDHYATSLYQPKKWCIEFTRKLCWRQTRPISSEIL
jgi:hypothetical protein